MAACELATARERIVVAWSGRAGATGRVAGLSGLVEGRLTVAWPGPAGTVLARQVVA
jgi:hypothetical protein